MKKLREFVIGLFLLFWVLLFVGSQIPAIQYVNLGIIAVSSILVGYSIWKNKGDWRWPAGLTVFAVFGLMRLLWLGKAPVAEFGGVDKVNNTLYFLLLAILAVQYFDGWKKGREWENALIGITIMIAVFEGLLAYYWFRNWWLVSGEWLSWPPIGYRLEGKLLGHPNVTSGFLNLSIPLVFARLLVNRSQGRRVIWAGALIILGAIQFFTSSRTGWVAGAAGIVVTFGLLQMPDLFESNIWLRLKRVATRRNIVLGVGALIIVGFAFVLLFSQAGITPGHGGRLDIWANALAVWSGDWLLGRGTWAFPVYYAQVTQAPPGFLAWQAHNIVLEFGAEYGLVGLGVLAAAFFSGLTLWWRAWKSSGQGTREALAAYAGVGVAVWIHHLGDHFIDINIYMAGLIIIFANVHVRAPQKMDDPKRNIFCLAVVAILLGAASVGVLSTAKGMGEYHQGVEKGLSGEWEQAAKDICDAADTRREVSFYQFECAMALAHQGDASNEDEGWVAKAIDYMERGLDEDPYWPLHWAFLSELQWRKGDRIAALESMQRASEAAPHHAELAFRLGWMLEASGEIDVAELAYRKAVHIQPWYGVIVNESGSALFEDVRNRYGVSVKGGGQQQAVVEAYIFYVKGDIRSAEFILREEIQRYYLNAEAHALLGLVLVDSDREDEGWLEVQTALLIRQTPMILDWAAETAKITGEDELAARYLWQAFELMSQIGYDSERYYEGVYHRRYLPHDSVPWVSRSDLLPQMVENMYWLAEYFAEIGESERAEEILDWLAVRGWDLQ